MEGLEIQESQFPMQESDDFCNSILSRYSNSADEHHQHLCAVIGAMSQGLKDQNQPLSLLAYFGAASSSLDRVSGETEPSGHVLNSLLTILSMLLPRLPNPILKKKFEFVSELVIRVLRLQSVNPVGAASGLKCVSHLLIVRGSVSWMDVSQLYGLLLNYVTDSRPKVRRQSHVCLRDVLLSFQGTAVLAPASEAIANIFERFLLLAGGSNANPSEGPKGAQEVLYILDALKDCLPMMSLKSSTNILKYYKSLLELHQPLVTRRITDSLNVLCLHPTGEVSAEILLELLGSLAISISTNETSADNMTFTARLLDVGMKKVYTVNRQICVVKLPVVFSALADVMASEHEEPLHVAVETLKGLIQSCIDETLIRQGVNQITENAKMASRRSAPTIIEKVCATIESLLDYRYGAVWDMSFQVVSALFDKLGDSSSYLLRKTLTSLADMQKLPDEDFPYRKQLHECIGSAVVAMGPETFLSLLPLKLEAQDLSEVNAWLFPILKQYTIGSSLGFFNESIFDMIGLVRKKSALLEQGGRIHAARSVDGLIYSLWSLLPSFCNYPSDTAQSFMDLEKTLSGSLRSEPDVRGIICSSLQILIQQNKKILEGNGDTSGIEASSPRQRALARYTPEVAADNLNALKSSAREILSVLSGIFLKTSKDDGGLLQSTIGEFASIADKDVVARFFKATMQKLLKVTQEAGKTQKSKHTSSMEIDNSSTEISLSMARAQLFDLAVSLLPGLDGKETDLLFVAIEPALKDIDGMIQKKAYKVLSIILKNSEGLISRKLEEVLNMMIEVLPSCHFSAKRHRLNCLYFLIVHVSKEDMEQRRHGVITSFLTEIVLALKEVNKKTRNKAYDIIVQIGHACGDEDRGGKKENLFQFFDMVAGGLASETPHVISAAVKGLARLAYEFTDLISSAYNVLPSALLLLQRKNREINKANLGLLKVLVAKSQAEGLQAHLRSVVEGLLNWQDSTKNHFKAKVKLLLEMLVKKCGLDAVKAVMPEEHMKLLTNIRKMKERKERKLAANIEETRSHLSKATTSRLSKWNHTKIFSDFGDEENDDSDKEYMDAGTSGRHTRIDSVNSKAATLRSKRMRKAAKLLPEDSFDQIDDEPLDLLDRQKTRSSLRSSEQKKPESDDELEIDPDGRLIIHEEGKKLKRQIPSEPDSDARSQAGSQVSMNSRKSQKRRKTSESGWAKTGSEYASKKAAGDVKRKDKLEPYAYWPLDRKMVSRRPEQRAAARKGMASVVKLTKKLEGKSVLNALSVKVRRGKKKSNKKNR